MLVKPTVLELLEKVDNRFQLVVATAKRARQIIDGSPELASVESKKPLTAAINEVNEGLVTYERPEVEER